MAISRPLIELIVIDEAQTAGSSEHIQDIPQKIPNRTPGWVAVGPWPRDERAWIIEDILEKGNVWFASMEEIVGHVKNASMTAASRTRRQRLFVSASLYWILSPGIRTRNPRHPRTPHQSNKFGMEYPK